MTREVPEALVDRFTASERSPLRAANLAVSAEVAVDALFRQHYPALLRLAVAMLGSRDGAEDAVQDAFVSLFRHWKQLRDTGSAEPYLRSAVLNRCRSGIRGKVRDRSLASVYVAPEPTEGGEEALTAHQDAAVLAGALRRLPRRQREVVACRYVLELSVAETAETLGISDGSVKRHAHRGLHALHTALEVTR